MKKITKESFELFNLECMKWIEKFGIKDYNVVTKHTRLNDDTKAYCTFHVVNRWAVLELNTGWDSSWDTSTMAIKKTGFHEVMELFLARLRNLAEYRYTTENEIDEAIHAIIRTLENVVFEQEYKNETGK